MDISALCDAALGKIQFVYVECFPCPEGWLVGTCYPNTIPDYAGASYLADLEVIKERGGDPDQKVTFEFRPHAPVPLRQLSGRLSGRLTLMAMQDIYAAVNRSISDEVALALCPATGEA
jgi:hypothetical protein